MFGATINIMLQIFGSDTSNKIVLIIIILQTLLTVVMLSVGLSDSSHSWTDLLKQFNLMGFGTFAFVIF